MTFAQWVAAYVPNSTKGERALMERAWNSALAIGQPKAAPPTTQTVAAAPRPVRRKRKATQPPGERGDE